MPVHLNWQQKLKAAADSVRVKVLPQTLKPDLRRMLVNPMTGTTLNHKEVVKMLSETEEKTRVRYITSSSRYFEVINIINKQLPKSEIHLFKQNGAITQLIHSYLSMPMDHAPTKVRLIFEKGSTEFNPNKMPATKLKRIYIRGNDDSWIKVWSRN